MSGEELAQKISELTVELLKLAKEEHIGFTITSWGEINVLLFQSQNVTADERFKRLGIDYRREKLKDSSDQYRWFYEAKVNNVVFRGNELV